MRIIFCQAHGDIVYTLNIIQNYNTKIIVITTLDSVNQVLNNLINSNLVELIHIPNPNNISERILFKKRFLRLINYLDRISVSEIYIFSRGFDWISLSIIKLFSDRWPKPYLINIYDNLSSNNNNKTSMYYLKLLARKIYYFLMTGVNFNYFTEVSSRPIVVIKDEFFIKKNKPRLTEKRYLIKSKIEQPSVLFIDSVSPILKEKIRNNLKEVLATILNEEIKVFVKKHPERKVTYDFLNQFPQIESIPIELIDVSDFTAILGIGSTALIENNCSLKISLLNLFQSQKNNKEINRFIKYLNNFDSDFALPNTIDKMMDLINEEIRNVN